jgi:hypothetical protein
MKICIQNSTLSCEGTVNLLGIEIDYRLNFDIHISSICRKTSQQLTGANLLTILYVSKAIVLIRLICKEGARAFSRRLIYELQNSTLLCEERVKLLGIEIDYQLNFDIDISSICRKASQQLNILKRLGRSGVVIVYKTKCSFLYFLKFF